MPFSSPATCSQSPSCASLCRFDLAVNQSIAKRNKSFHFLARLVFDWFHAPELIYPEVTYFCKWGDCSSAHLDEFGLPWSHTLQLMSQPETTIFQLYVVLAANLHLILYLVSLCTSIYFPLMVSKAIYHKSSWRRITIMLYIGFFSEFTVAHNGTLSCNEQHPVHFNCIAILKGSAQQCC